MNGHYNEIYYNSSIPATAHVIGYFVKVMGSKFRVTENFPKMLFSGVGIRGDSREKYFKVSAKGARIEAQKAPSGWSTGRGCPFPIRLWDIGTEPLRHGRQLPQRGPGLRPGRKHILAYFEGQRTLLV